jgi:hypothetical protein
MKIPPLVVFPDSELGFALWVAGGEHEVVDGVDFLVAQSFLARKGFSVGDVAADELGQLWRFTSDVTPGFSFSGIVLKLEG